MPPLGHPNEKSLVMPLDEETFIVLEMFKYRRPDCNGWVEGFLFLSSKNSSYSCSQNEAGGLFKVCPLLLKLRSKECGLTVGVDPRIWLLGDVSLLKLASKKKHLASKKKCILKNWRSIELPKQRHWPTELLCFCTPEKILNSLQAGTCNLWV